MAESKRDERHGVACDCDACHARVMARPCHLCRDGSCDMCADKLMTMSAAGRAAYLARFRS